MRYDARNLPAKVWSWSYSKLKNYRTCPRRYHDIDVAKLYVEPGEAKPGSPLYEGNRLHKAFEDRIKDGTKLPADFAMHEEAMVRLASLPGTTLVEQQLAIKEDLSPSDWFGRETWYRAKCDFLNISENGKVALAIDYKTGKILEDSEQLALMAECIFSHYPNVLAVRTEFWWMRDDAATREDFRRRNRHETWQKLLPEVMTLKQAHDTMTFPPKQNGLCRNHCIVKGCPHYGGAK